MEKKRTNWDTSQKTLDDTLQKILNDTLHLSSAVSSKISTAATWILKSWPFKDTLRWLKENDPSGHKTDPRKAEY